MSEDQLTLADLRKSAVSSLHVVLSRPANCSILVILLVYLHSVEKGRRCGIHCGLQWKAAKRTHFASGLLAASKASHGFFLHSLISVVQALDGGGLGFSV